MSGKMTPAKAINHLIKTLSANDQVSTEGISDGYHTFGDLYNQRLYLTAALFNLFPDRAYKTLRHADGEPCFGGGWFLVLVETPNGPYSYHYETKFWNLFKIPEREKADPWDGHTSKDVKRLLSLTREVTGLPGNVAYICDTHNEKCYSSGQCESGYCTHTFDISHAKNFNEFSGTYWEIPSINGERIES